MASNGGSEQISGGAGADRAPSRPGRTAAEQRADEVGSTDPDVLAAQIERTREELAVTFDAIVDRVSPKRVARRTSKRVGETVKEKAAEAGEAVKSGAAQVRQTASGAVETVREKVSSSSPAGAPGGSVALDTGGTSAAAAGADLPPTEPVTVPSLATGAPLTAAPGTGPAGAPAHFGGVTTYSTPPVLDKQYVAAGAVATVVALLLLLLRRRRRG